MSCLSRSGGIGNSLGSLINTQNIGENPISIRIVRNVMYCSKWTERYKTFIDIGLAGGCYYNV